VRLDLLDPEWQEERDELIAALRRAARSQTRKDV
jgi:hypothetical protein